MLLFRISDVKTQKKKNLVHQRQFTPTTRILNLNYRLCWTLLDDKTYIYQYVYSYIHFIQAGLFCMPSIHFSKNTLPITPL